MGGLTPTKIGPLDGAVARVFPNVSLAMCPLNLSSPPYLLDSGAGTGRRLDEFQSLQTNENGDLVDAEDVLFGSSEYAVGVKGLVSFLLHCNASTLVLEILKHGKIWVTACTSVPHRVSGTLCLLHYVTETSHLYSLRDF